MAESTPIAPAVGFSGIMKATEGSPRQQTPWVTGGGAGASARCPSSVRQVPSRATASASRPSGRSFGQRWRSPPPPRSLPLVNPRSVDHGGVPVRSSPEISHKRPKMACEPVVEMPVRQIRSRCPRVGSRQRPAPRPCRLDRRCARTTRRFGTCAKQASGNFGEEEERGAEVPPIKYVFPAFAARPSKVQYNGRKRRSCSPV